MKKFIALLLVVVLTATVAVGGTLAYLTDRDSKVNTFTVGDVSIKLNEDFVQDSTLIPGVDITKKASITNTGKNDAWVWAAIAIPAVLDDDNDASKNIVHFNYDSTYVGAGQWTWQDSDGNWLVSQTEIDGVNYNVYSVLYQSPVARDAVTPNFLEKVYLDPHVDIDPNGDWYWVENGETKAINWNSNTNGNPKIYVSAYAIQKEGFADVEAAYKAYQDQWGDNGAEWGRNEVKVEGNTVDALKAAIAAAEEGTTLVLNEDFDLGANTVTIEKNIAVDLNGNTITSSARNGVFYLKNGASLENGTIVHNGTVAGIKVWQSNGIENVDLILGGTSGSGNAITGISVQEGADTYLKSLKNVTITTAGGNKTYNGVETYNCGNTAMAIGSMENVKIDVNGTALLLSAPAGTATNCTFSGDVCGINAHLKGDYNVSLKLVDCTVEGGVKVWDEPATNPGSLKIEAEGTTVSGTVSIEASENFGDRWSVTGLN